LLCCDFLTSFSQLCFLWPFSLSALISSPLLAVFFFLVKGRGLRERLEEDQTSLSFVDRLPNSKSNCYEEELGSHQVNQKGFVLARLAAQILRDSVRVVRLAIQICFLQKDLFPRFVENCRSGTVRQQVSEEVLLPSPLYKSHFWRCFSLPVPSRDPYRVKVTDPVWVAFQLCCCIRRSEWSLWHLSGTMDSLSDASASRSCSHRRRSEDRVPTGLPGASGRSKFDTRAPQLAS